MEPKAAPAPSADSLDTALVPAAIRPPRRQRLTARQLRDRLWSLLPVQPDHGTAPPLTDSRLIALVLASAASAIYLAYVISCAVPGGLAAASGHAQPGALIDTRSMLMSAAALILPTSLALIMLILSGTPLLPDRSRGRARAVLAGSAAVFALAETPALLADLLWWPARTIPWVAVHSGGENHGTFAADVLYAAAAGFSEELAALAVPIALVRALLNLTGRPRLGRTGTSVLVCALVLVRLSYHVELGVSVCTLVPWAAMSALIGWRAPRAWASLVAAHAVFDVLNAADDLHPYAALVALLTGAVAAVAYAWRASGPRPGSVAV